MKNLTLSFALLEFLIVISILAVLAAVLIPNLLQAVDKANATVANIVRRTVLNGMAHVEVDNEVAANCIFSTNFVTITAVSNREVVNANRSVTNVQCVSNILAWQVNVDYVNRSVAKNRSYSAAK